MTGNTKDIFTGELVDINHVLDYLNQMAEVWDFSRLLTEIYSGKGSVSQCLQKKLAEYDPDENPSQISRKVRNWIHNRNLPGNREELFKICFALRLNVTQAEYILGITADNGIHYRNPRELIYAFALRSEMDYPEAAQLVCKLWKDPLPSGTLEYRRQMKSTSATEKCGKMTASIRNEFKQVTSEAELAKFLLDYRQNFGIHHNTAYRKFMKMLNYLLFPQYNLADLPPEKVYSVERVVREYIRMGIPYDKQSKGYTKLQKMVKRHWPTAKTIHEMCSRKTDVDRKTLMLLYLATEGMAVNCGTGKRVLMEHYRRVNLMLAECGMSGINLHSPFDYMVMQAINKENEDDFMSYRMEWMLNRLYSTGSRAAFITTKEGR